MAEYYEDVTVGDTWQFGEKTVSKTEIIEFAEQFDPQPFHVDEAAAKETMFGGLIASGWHTAAMCMRLYVDNMGGEGWLGARGVDSLRWIRPVRPGDTLTVEVEMVDKYPDEDNPALGHVETRLTGYADGEPAITWVGLGMIERRTS